MQISRVYLALASCLVVGLLTMSSVMARPDASTKFAIIREESPHAGRAMLILPYAFPSESMGATFGVGGMVRGYLQEQLLLGGTVFGSLDHARGFVAGMWDYRLPWTERFYFSMLGSIAHYPRLRAYTEVPRRPSGAAPPQAGTNDSDEDNYIEDAGQDNWLSLKLEYVLPIGSMQNRSVAAYHLRHGILQSGATGGKTWNPLASGISVLMLAQESRYQRFETDTVTYEGDTFPLRLGYFYNNTDFPSNPSYGSSQYMAYSQDFSDRPWSFIEFEASKYFDLGASHYAWQRVLALNFWTGTSPSWSDTTHEQGITVVEDNPPYLEGAHLGGFYRMRGYPNNRFNDRSVIYTSAEYRYTLKWNPVADIAWLRWLQVDWFQVVGFVEGGRVAGDYDLGELFSAWKVDGGIGIRSMMAGSVVRFDFGISEEGVTGWAMFGHPF